MSAHIHAALMAQYAQDAAETDKPWERWEFFRNGQWLTMPDDPVWIPHFQYRRKPKAILINGFEVPEPMREAPETGTRYWAADLSAGSMTTDFCWADDKVDNNCLRCGICHTTKEAAEAHANALLSFTRSDK